MPGVLISCNIVFQDRSNSYDTMKFTSFENQLLDIMRSTTSMAIDPTEQIKGRLNKASIVLLCSKCSKISYTKVSFFFWLKV